MEESNLANKEKTEYLSEISALKDNINKLNQIIDNNNNEINSLKEEIILLEERTNNDSFIRKLFKNGE